MGTGWQNRMACNQLINEDVEALLYLPGGEVKRPGPVTGTFLRELTRSHFHKEVENMVEDMTPGLPELQHLFTHTANKC